MTRTYAASVNSYLSEPVVELRLLADVSFVNTTMRLHTGVGSLMVGATHYDGVGYLGGIDSITEDPDSFTPVVNCYLAAVESASLTEALNERLFNRQVVLKRAFINNGTLVNTPEQWFDGKIGEVNLVRDDPSRGTYIDVTLQTRMDQSRRIKYFTKEDHWQTYSGDTFFNFTHQIEGQVALWGQMMTLFGGPMTMGKNPWHNLRNYIKMTKGK